MDREKEQGKVFLVGAGPGDPELMTVKAVRLLQTADVIIYDRLVSDAIMDMASPKAEMIYAGKASNKHTIPQEEISRLLVTKAKEGKTVVRLKGGDLFVFGRGGEETLELKAAGVSFEVVPGITSATGVSSYAGIPLTHRGISTSVTLVTGHAQKSDTHPDLNWEILSMPNQTLVFYMGLITLPQITYQLVQHGLSEETPVAVIHKGTMPEQRTVVGKIKNIAQLVSQKELSPPSLVIIGQVVQLREQLKWFQESISIVP